MFKTEMYKQKNKEICNAQMIFRTIAKYFGSSLVTKETHA